MKTRDPISIKAEIYWTEQEIARVGKKQKDGSCSASIRDLAAEMRRLKIVLSRLHAELRGARAIEAAV